MKSLAASKSFQKQLRKLPMLDQQNATAALKVFLQSLQEGQLRPGLGFKKINCDKYEIRAGLNLRIVMKLDQETFVCLVVGNHEDVRCYLRDWRHR